MPSTKDIVVGLDSSTTATKAIAFHLDGAIVAQGRGPIPLHTPAHNRYEQNPEDWWRSACEALRAMCSHIDANRIAAVAISNQRETFVPLSRDGRPVRPAIVWLDQRCEDEVAWLSSRVGADRIHKITGKPPDLAPVAYRIAWMLRHEPDLFRRTSIFADVHSYLAFRLTGSFQTSWASADPLGLFDIESREWSPEILRALDLSPDRLPRPVRPGTIIGPITESAASATSLAPGTLVVAGGGDGQSAGLGVNALDPARAYLNFGTALVGGVYSYQYKTGQAWRTMGSLSGDGYYFETSLRAGTFLIDWFTRQFCLPSTYEVAPSLARHHRAKSGKELGHDDLTPSSPAPTALLRQLEVEASTLPIGSDGLLALPYWGAVMTPYWDPLARGCWIGLSGSHTRGHMYRSLLEGTALEQALVTRMIEDATGNAVSEFIAIGGGASSDLWCSIMADVTGKTVRRSRILEASSLGAAICAAVGAGHFPTAAHAAKVMCDQHFHDIHPSAENHTRYRDLLAIYKELYPVLRATFHRLAQFCAGNPAGK